MLPISKIIIAISLIFFTFQSCKSNKEAEATEYMRENRPVLADLCKKEFPLVPTKVVEKIKIKSDTIVKTDTITIKCKKDQIIRTPVKYKIIRDTIFKTVDNTIIDPREAELLMEANKKLAVTEYMHKKEVKRASLYQKWFFSIALIIFIFVIYKIVRKWK